MLKTSFPDVAEHARVWGRPTVYRNRCGHGRPRLSRAPHKFMDANQRATLVAKLERDANKRQA